LLPSDCVARLNGRFANEIDRIDPVDFPFGEERHKSVTEAEWLSSSNPQPMLAYLAGRAGERELREFAAACCLRVWHLLPHQGNDFREVLERCQRLARAREADADAERAELYLAAVASCAAFAAAAAEHVGAEAEQFAAHAVYAASALTGSGYADEAVLVWSVAADAAAADESTVGVAERVAQAELARRVFANPFRK
jgi:hypothetical protein